MASSKASSDIPRPTAPVSRGQSIQYPEPTSQSHSNRIFFIPDHITGASSRRPRHAVSVPQLSRSFFNPRVSEQSHPLSQENSSDRLEGSSQGLPSNHIHLGKLKLKLPYSIGKSRFNKFISKSLIPSFLYSSDSTASENTFSTSSRTSESNLKSTTDHSTEVSTSESHEENQSNHDQIQHQVHQGSHSPSSMTRHAVISNSSTPNLHLNFPPSLVISVPEETASIRSLRASRSRQGSVSTTYTTPDTEAVSIHEGFVGFQSSSSNDNNSLYGLTAIDKQATSTSYHSLASTTSEYYAQQFQIQQMQHHQVRSKRSFFFDTDSGIFNDNFASAGSSKDRANFKLDFVTLFPREITIHVFEYLDPKSLTACALVSKSWNRFALMNVTWRSLYYQIPHWDTIKDSLPNNGPVTWNSVYRTRKELEKRWNSGEVEPRALTGHSDSVYCVHYNDKYIVTGSRDRTIKVWDANSCKLIKSLGLDINYNLDEAREVETTTANRTNQITTDAMFGSVSAFSTPQNVSLSQSSNDIEANQDNNNLIRHTKSILCVLFDDTMMVSGSSDSSIILWKFPEFKAFTKITGHTGGVLDVGLDDKYICSGSKDSSVCIWERPVPNKDGEFPENLPVKLKFKFENHRGPINSVQIQGKYVFSGGGDGIVKMYDLELGACIREFKGHSRGIACIRISPDNRRLVSGSNDKNICVWDVSTGECLHVLDKHTALVRSLDISSGRIISGSYDQTIKIWDLETGRLISDFDNFFGSWVFSAKASCKKIVCTSFGYKPVVLDYTKGLDRNCLNFISA